jgi:mannose-6-phosphate isomerase mannose-1-phosphate guanylyl transferase
MEECIIDVETESLTIKITSSARRLLTYHMKECCDELCLMIEGCSWVKPGGNEFAVAEGQTIRIPYGAFHPIHAETLLKEMKISMWRIRLCEEE